MSGYQAGASKLDLFNTNHESYAVNWDMRGCESCAVRY